ncbi:MAG TPA: DUF4439 domain-containing protein [Jatrophihabitans sp.]|jgi:hypothetical protein
MNSTPQAVRAAWQDALAAEQQAAFGYALVGPHLPGDRQDLARSYQALHEQLRDSTAAAIEAAGARPVAALGDYPALYGIAPLILAPQLEDDCAAAWRYFYSALATAQRPPPAFAPLRRSAQRALTASALRATRWRLLTGARHAVVAFPGTPTTQK